MHVRNRRFQDYRPLNLLLSRIENTLVLAYLVGHEVQKDRRARRVPDVASLRGRLRGRRFVGAERGCPSHRGHPAEQQPTKCLPGVTRQRSSASATESEDGGAEAKNGHAGNVICIFEVSSNCQIISEFAHKRFIWYDLAHDGCDLAMARTELTLPPRRVVTGQEWPVREGHEF